jgi:hypothetical protein
MNSSTLEDRWDRLRTFVDAIYAKPLELPAAATDGSAPLALREWFAITANRRPKTGGAAEYPRARGFSRWPDPPKSVPEHWRPFVERGLLPVVMSDDAGGWGLDLTDGRDDPPVHVLHYEEPPTYGQRTQPFAGSLSQLLTLVVLTETLYGVSVFGRRRAGSRILHDRLEADPGSHMIEYLHGPDFQPLWPDWPALEGRSFLRHRAGHTWTERRQLSTLTQTPEAWKVLWGRHTRDLEEATRTEQEAAQAKLDGKRQRLAELGGPTTGPELVAALTAIEGSLRRFEVIFLTDLRRAVAAGTASSGSLLKAGEILRERSNS